MMNVSSDRPREVFLFSYLWDIVDEGPDHFAQRLVEELGVTGVALAVAYHDGRFLLPHHSRRRMYVLEPARHLLSQRPIALRRHAAQADPVVRARRRSR